MEQFDVPVALIFFNRPHYLKKVVEVIQKLKPKKLYLISDGARKDRVGEEKLVQECRDLIDNSINWDCIVEKNYATENKGCYDRIANGASWIFSKEERCIFLEDDNVAELSFFEFCKENLEKYKDNKKIFWICGGNYLVDYKNNDDSDYLFSRQMFPCGWASWKRAWEYYDGEIKLFDNEKIRLEVLNKIKNKRIRNYKSYVWNKIRKEAKNGERIYTWDHQWNFSILLNDAYGIIPKKNQITNIGIGEDSTHGGVKMTKHLSGIVNLESHTIQFPLKHPEKIQIDENFERLIEKRIKGIPTYMLFLSKIKHSILGKRKRK